MRILVTKNGEDFVEQLSLMRDNSVQPLRRVKCKSRIGFYNKNKRKNKSNPRPMIAISRNIENNNLMNSMSSFKDSFSNQKKRNSINESEESSLTPINVHRKVSVKKFFIPKYFMDKYETNSNSTKNIITRSSLFLPNVKKNQTIISKEEEDLNDIKKNNFFNNENHTIIVNNNYNNNKEKKYFSFKQIIPSKTLINIKKKIIKEKTEKEKEFKLNETNFRTIYKANPLKEFNDIINQPCLEYGNVQLIKFFNEKKDTSPLRIKEIVSSSQFKLEKINKICQTINENNNKEKLLKNEISRKILEKKNSEKIKCYNIIKSVEKNVDKFKGKLKKYKHKVDDKERYKDILKEISLKYWNKFNFDKFNKKSTPKSESKYLAIQKPDETENIIPKEKIKFGF